MGKRRTPVMKSETNTSKAARKARQTPGNARKRNGKPIADHGVIVGCDSPEAVDVMESLCDAIGVKLVTVEGPLVPDDPEDDDDDTPGTS